MERSPQDLLAKLGLLGKLAALSTTTPLISSPADISRLNFEEILEKRMIFVVLPASR